MKQILVILAALLLMTMGMPNIEAASSSYYASTVVYFNVPTDATFSISMPSDYGSWTQITGTAEGTATATDWISFNFSNVPQAALQEPYQLGAAADAQSGTAKPIYYIDPTGNTNMSFEIKINESAPTGVEVYFNATCDTGGACGTVQTALLAMSTSYQTAASEVNSTSFLNLSTYANTSGAAVAGITAKKFFIKSTAV